MTFNPASITAERSLWEVWTAVRRMPRCVFNRRCLIAAVLAMLPYVILTKQSTQEIAESARSVASDGLGFAAAVLGFLVAGFTIFATLSKPSLLSNMARITDERSGVSYLKSSFYVFFETFGWYLGFAACSVVIAVFGKKGVPISFAASLLPAFAHALMTTVIARSTMFVVGIWLIWLVLELKSFMFNLYHVVVMSIRWTIEYPDPDMSTCNYQREDSLTEEATLDGSRRS